MRYRRDKDDALLSSTERLVVALVVIVVAAALIFAWPGFTGDDGGATLGDERTASTGMPAGSRPGSSISADTRRTVA